MSRQWSSEPPMTSWPYRWMTKAIFIGPEAAIRSRRNLPREILEPPEFPPAAFDQALPKRLIPDDQVDELGDRSGRLSRSRTPASPSV